MVNQADHDQAGDHVESLDAIAKAGAVLDAPPAGSPGEPGRALALQQDHDAKEMALALELVRAAAIPFAPQHTHQALLAIWSDAQLLKIAEAIVALCQYHGWTVGQFFQEFGPYMQLAAALGLPALATLKVLKMPPPPPAAAHGQQQPA